MITIVFGKPGAGKTAYLAQDAVRYLNFGPDSAELHDQARKKIEELNGDGGLFLVPYLPPVYTNFPLTVNAGTSVLGRSYYVDGFHLGFENPDVDVMPVLPGARIYLSEAQRYYNSRRSKDLPDWVSRWYEEHRHFGLQIHLDVQRPALIDVNIRELCERFIEVRGLEHEVDGLGRIIRSTFTVRVFEDWKYVEKYIDGTALNCQYEEQQLVYEGNIFECYESHVYFRHFIPTRADFSQILHICGRDVLEDSEISKILYRQTPPEGFYPSRGSNTRKGDTNICLSS